jgi:hypothetical protein
VLFRDGVPVATLVSGEVGILAQLTPSEEWDATKLLQREPARMARRRPAVA